MYSPTSKIFPSAAAMTAVIIVSLAAVSIGVPQTDKVVGADVRVGIDGGDFQGADQRALQAAVDHVAGLGGGTVHVGPGRYQMRNALRLRDHVRITGEPGKTILIACESCETRLAADGDCNERQITVEDESLFRIGDGVAIRDKRNGNGFAVTTATLTGQVNAKTFRISAPLYLDYMVSDNAVARLAFPLVGGWNVKDALVEGLTIDGQSSQNTRLDGCRGGGIYLFQCAAVKVRNCVVRGYYGDGISFQVSDQVTIEDCLCEENTGLGLHPGSGSQKPVVRRNRSLNNGGDGLFVCWRVKHGLFEQNEIRANRGVGISIGHKDTDNLFRNNIIVNNAGPGVLFRGESEPMGAHRNIFEGNRIVDNGLPESGKPSRACIVIKGHHHDLVFRNNTIGRSQSAPGSVGILRSNHVRDLQATDNEFPNIETPVQLDEQ